jgi:hypothetical protein
MALVVLAIWIVGCSSDDTPTVKIRDGSEGISELDQVVGQLKSGCTKRSGKIRLDLEQGDAHLRHVFGCNLVRSNEARAEAAVLDLVRTRHDATRRADRVIRFATAFNVKSRLDNRAGLVWSIGTGFDGASCTRAGDSTFHRDELALVTPPGANHESPTRWTEIEASWVAAVCPDRLPIFFSSLARAGQSAAANIVRTELQRLGPEVERALVRDSDPRGTMNLADQIN